MAGLVVLNVITGISTNTRPSSTYPGYPSIMFAYNAGNITILIRGALGPYFYNNITVTAVYQDAGGHAQSLVKYAVNTYYLGFKVHTSSMSVNATAIDGSQSTEYYYNASITVNPSAPSSLEKTVTGSSRVHVLVIGNTPYVGAMEGARLA